MSTHQLLKYILKIAPHVQSFKSYLLRWTGFKMVTIMLIRKVQIA